MVSPSPAPKPAARPLRLEAFLPYRLSVLSNRVSRAIAGVYSEQFGLSISEWRVIAVLGRFPGLSAAEVAERTAMDKVAVSRAVARLFEKGCLEQNRSASDRRRSVLVLTREGVTLFETISPLARDYERKLLACLPAADKKRLDSILASLLERAELLEAP